MTQVVTQRENSDLAVVLAAAKQQHIESIGEIYSEAQPKLVLGQRHGHSSSQPDTGSSRSRPTTGNSASHRDGIAGAGGDKKKEGGEHSIKEARRIFSDIKKTQYGVIDMQPHSDEMIQNLYTEKLGSSYTVTLAGTSVLVYFGGLYVHAMDVIFSTECCTRKIYQDL